MNSSSQLHNDPRIQAAAAAYMSVNVTYTLEEEDADAFSDKATQAITDCYEAMGISETSPWADEVARSGSRTRTYDATHLSRKQSAPFRLRRGVAGTGSVVVGKT
jgi:hypothetical protein